MLIAQITDLHITALGSRLFGHVDTAGHLARAVSSLLALDPQPDVVLATGDLVDGGDPVEYAHLRHLLRPLRRPSFIIPGNHDERSALRKAFGDCAYLPAGSGYLHYTVEDWPVRLIGLDSVDAGAPGGVLCRDRLAWLSQRLLEQPDRPTLIFMHHPPFSTGIEHMDATGLRDAEGLAQVVSHHPQVERIVCGHVHRSIQARFAGTIASVAPSTAHQVSLDLRAAADATFSMEPPGYHLHLWRRETGLVTHTVPVGTYPGPYPFE